MFLKQRVLLFACKSSYATSEQASWKWSLRLQVDFLSEGIVFWLNYHSSLHQSLNQLKSSRVIKNMTGCCSRLSFPLKYQVCLCFHLLIRAPPSNGSPREKIDIYWEYGAKESRTYLITLVYIFSPDLKFMSNLWWGFNWTLAVWSSKQCADNKSWNRMNQRSPSEIIYGYNPTGVLESILYWIIECPSSQDYLWMKLLNEGLIQVDYLGGLTNVFIEH